MKRRDLFKGLFGLVAGWWVGWPTSVDGKTQDDPIAIPQPPSFKAAYEHQECPPMDGAHRAHSWRNLETGESWETQVYHLYGGYRSKPDQAGEVIMEPTQIIGELREVYHRSHVGAEPRKSEEHIDYFQNPIPL